VEILKSIPEGELLLMGIVAGLAGNPRVPVRLVQDSPSFVGKV